MRRKIILLLSIILGIILIIQVGTLIGGTDSGESNVYHKSIDNIPKERLISQVIHTGLERWHYSGRKIDDEFSEKAFIQFIELLDPNKRFLLKSDIETLRKYRDKIDDQLQVGSTEMMDLAGKLLENRINQVKSFYEKILNTPFDFNKEEYIESDPDKIDYCQNLDELMEYWRKTLKYRVLLRYHSLLKTDKSSTKKGTGNTEDRASASISANKIEKDIQKFDKELEKKARQSVLKSFKAIFHRLLQANKDDSLSRYLNSLVQVYDPHSTYFLPVDKESFDMQMSGSFEGIGALLQNEDEYVKVASIVPGGPSWRGKQLQAGDLILKVAQGNNEPVDIIGMRTVEAVKLIRGKKGTLVRLTVKKPDGQIIEIPIMRDVVILEDTFARSAVLVDKESGRRFGYIDLPGFYNDFSTIGGRNATDDVNKEIEKLKFKNVQGIILDLRSNTGGALQDAVRMSGLFIPQGPIVQVKDKESKINPLKDFDEEVSYDGPLVVMVNRLSASASEILAAALQDYNRAIIVGGDHSFGKGTVQAMVNLDNLLAHHRRSREEKYQSFGAMTITIQKFYRINGKAIQLKGVQPDIVLPDRHDFLEIGEEHLDNSMAWDSVPPTKFEKWQLDPLVSQELKLRSQARVKNNNNFKGLKEYIKKIEEMREDSRQSLRLSDILNRQQEVKLIRDKLDDMQADLAAHEIEPSAELPKKDSEGLNQIAKERQSQWFEELQKDIYIDEVINILKDFIELNKS